MDNIALFFLIFNLSHQFPFLDSLMIFITKYLLYIAILLMFILAFKGKLSEKKALLLAILTIPIAILLIKGIHIFINEPRPFVTYHFPPLTDNKPDASFPSRHATIMAVIAFAYTYVKSKWAYLFLVLMILVGISRVYVGVHYPLDVISGFIVGAISLAIVLFSANLLRARI